MTVGFLAAGPIAGVLSDRYGPRPFAVGGMLVMVLGADVLGSLPAASVARLTGLDFFPGLLAGPFHDGLVIVFGMAIAMSVLGGFASLIRKKHLMEWRPGVDG